MELNTFRVTGIDLDHDGERYPIGSMIDLDQKTASALRNWLDPVPAELLQQPPPENNGKPVVTDPVQAIDPPDNSASKADDSADGNPADKTGDDAKPANTKGQRSGQGANK